MSGGGFLLLCRCSFFCGKWEWSQRPKDDGPGSSDRPGVLRVAERGDAVAAGRALVGMLGLLLLKHELVLVLIKSDSQ